MRMSFGSIFCLYAILVSLCNVPLRHAAPAQQQQQQQQQQHHLSIGVEGDTPTLIVTSAEIGLTPELLLDSMPAKATPTATATTTTSMSEMTVPMHVEVSKAEPVEAEEEEDVSVTTAKTANIKSDETVSDEDTPMPKATAATLLTMTATATATTTTTVALETPQRTWPSEEVEQTDEERGTKAMTTPTPTTTTTTTTIPEYASNLNVKQTKTLQVTKRNEEATTTTTATATATATMQELLNSYNNNANTLPTTVTETVVALNTSKIIAVASDNQLQAADKVPATIATDTLTSQPSLPPLPSLPSASSSPPSPTTTTTAAAATMTVAVNAVSDATTNDKPTSFVPTQAQTQIQTETQTTTATATATTNALNALTKTMPIEEGNKNNVVAKAEAEAEAEDNQQNTSLNSFVVAYDDEILTIDRPQQSESVATTQTTQSTTTTTTDTDTLKETTAKQNEGVKLIDLEQTNSPLALSNAFRKQIGHDGHKETMKKQLAVLNFKASATAAAATEATTTTTKMATKKTLTTLLAATQATKPPPATLLPVHNGYLGPIFMGEKTFSVVHPLKKPQAQQEQQQQQQQQQHQHKPPSIEEQLRDGRLVEIIAPTALLEQTPSTSTQRTALGKTTAPPTPASTTTTEHMSNSRGGHSNSLEFEGNVHAPPVLSTTVFQVPETQTSTTRQPGEAKDKLSNSPVAFAGADIRTESKISDIQIEVYDSTVDSIVASTNFKDNNEGFFALPLDATIGTTRPPVSGVTQERFTQYVIDRADVSTQESSVSPLSIAAGKPEPAAIEIHINVSEGFGNESEDLEFSYRQPDYSSNNNNNNNNNNIIHNAGKSMKSFSSANNLNSKERSDEILVVEIIDTGDNMTENSASSEHINPIFTFRADTETADVELKDVKYLPPETIVRPPQVTDELFMADVKGVLAGSDTSFSAPPPPPPPPPRKPSIDRDSDTIFYISNTEVKVGESLPTLKPSLDQQQQQQQQQQLLRKSRLENQFFPVNYAPSQAQSSGGGGEHHRYEEDIILSPLRNTADALKIFRSQGNQIGGGAVAVDSAPPLDVTYVGESVIEVEQSGSGASQLTTTHTPDVIIQPAILPEMSIGVPVIGELPPQIELKEIDFMPGELTASQAGNGLSMGMGMGMGIGGGGVGANIYENELDEHAENSIAGGVYYSGGIGAGGVADPNANDRNRLLESSIQYGGDLIDDGAGGGFDGIEGSYPFENPANLQHKQQPSLSYAHFNINHGVNNLRKDELSAELPSSLVSGIGIGIGIGSEGTPISLMHDNATVLPQQRTGNDNESLAMFNGTSSTSNNSNNNKNITTQTQAERGAGNATAYSEEEPSNFMSENGYLNFFAVSVGLVIIILPVLLFLSVFCAIRYFMHHKQRSANDEQDSEEGTVGANGKDADISRNARETKMHTDKDGVFVVEVARGIDSTHAMPDSPSAETTELPFDAKPAAANGLASVLTTSTLTSASASSSSSAATAALSRGGDATALMTSSSSLHDAAVQIHAPPMDIVAAAAAEELQRSLHLIEEVEEEPAVAVGLNAMSEAVEVPADGELGELAATLRQCSNTGLSQSDLSTTSSSDSNKRYSYGNQELYIIEQSGYATTSPTATQLIANRVDGDILADDNDRKSENGNSLEHTPAGAKPAELELPVDGSTANEPNANEQVAAVENEEEEEDENKEKKKRIISVADEQNQPIEEQNGIQENADKQDEEQLEDQHSAKVAELSIETPLNMNENFKKTEVNVAAIDAQANEVADVEADAVNDVGAELAYDSIMSLPDPPSNEEIIQLNDFTLIESNQLDSLPPPPPPLLPLQQQQQQQQQEAAESEAIDVINGNNAEFSAQFVGKSAEGNDEKMATLTNGNVLPTMQQLATTATATATTAAVAVAAEKLYAATHPPANMTDMSNGKLVPSTLTPPASPPASPAANVSAQSSPSLPPPTSSSTSTAGTLYGNGLANGVGVGVGVNAGICAPLPAVAVDVNGS